MTQVIGYVGSNRGFGRVLRELRKLAMRGATLQHDQRKVDRALRKAKMKDIRRQYRGPQNAA